MIELNPIRQRIADLQDRLASLRGYLWLRCQARAPGRSKPRAGKPGHLEQRRIRPTARPRAVAAGQDGQRHPRHRGRP